ncbi:MAG: diguanylate cyclase, partial [Defluviitaleaceae bacterium]|nr:diguanylate cyclase [Defluviitaleaceae bacterium]
MSKYIIKRLLLSVVILFFVALIVYTIMRCIPASFAETTARQLSSKPGAPSYQTLLKRLNEIYHMDRGIIPGYISWIGDALRGN